MKKVLFISHFSGTPGGPVDKLYEFLRKNNSVYNIKHPLIPNSDLKSSITDGKEKVQFKITPSFQYFFEGLVTLFKFRSNFDPDKIDFAICFDSLSFIQLYFFKDFFKVRKIIFYNCDYSKKRFANPILNFIYQQANFFAYKKCAYFFSLSARFIEDIDPEKKYQNKNYILSGMVDLKSINRNVKQLKNYLVYAGVLEYGSVDFDPLLKSLEKLKKSKVDFILDLYGKENPNSSIRKKISQMKLQSHINFKGTVENKTLVENILPQYVVGLAPYVSRNNPSAPDHAFLATDLTAKLVDYIAAGLPVITSELNNGFKEIEKNKFGFLVKSEEDWFRKIKTFLTNKQIRNEYGKNALNYAKKYDISIIINPILEKVLS